ncbi:MAG: hypothetical protein ACKOBD_07785 [Chloroflexota bacterium]
MSSIPRLMRGLGWIIFTLMWVPFMLMFMDMPAGNHTYGSISELPGKMGLYLVITVGMSIIAIGLLVGSGVVGWLFGRIALSRGESGTARILNITPTGTRVNHYYYGMRFTLEVQSFGESFQADAERLIPMHEMTKYQTGMMVNVKYDPITKIIAMVD